VRQTPLGLAVLVAEETEVIVLLPHKTEPQTRVVAVVAGVFQVILKAAQAALV
jgi:hypothetical protein